MIEYQASSDMDLGMPETAKLGNQPNPGSYLMNRGEAATTPPV